MTPPLLRSGAGLPLKVALAILSPGLGPLPLPETPPAALWYEIMLSSRAMAAAKAEAAAAVPLCCPQRWFRILAVILQNWFGSLN